MIKKNWELKNVDNPNSINEEINLKDYENLKKNQVIFEGMIPKLDNCFHALKNKVQKVHVGKTDMLFNHQTKHTLLQFTVYTALYFTELNCSVLKCYILPLVLSSFPPPWVKVYCITNIHI